MIKNLISYLVAFSVVLGGMAPALAQPKNIPPLPNKPKIMGVATTTPAMRLQEKQERMEARIQKLEERRKQMIKKFVEKMVRRFEAAVNRLKKLADRIDSRLTKFATERGKDVTLLRARLAEAKVKITEAEAAINAAKAGLDGALNSETPREAFEAVKKLVSDARDKIKEAHVALVKVVTEIKGASGGVKGGTATTTPIIVP